MTCRRCLAATLLAILAACARPQQVQEEVQPDHEMADEEASHWGVAIAMLALQVCRSVLPPVACALYVHA